MGKQKRVILITGAGGPLGVNVTRSLLLKEDKYLLIGTDANPYHLPMSLTHRRFLIPHAREKEAYLEALKKIISNCGVELVIPTHPIEVRTVSLLRDELKPAMTFLPQHETILKGQDKWRSYEIWKGKGLPVPLTYRIDGEEDIERIFMEIETRPIWVRGAGVPGAGQGVASLPCSNEEEARFWVRYWKGFGNFIASEYLPGKNLTWIGIWKEGRLITSQGRERLEYIIPHVSPSGITGAPAVSRTIHREDLNWIAPLAMEAIDPEPNGVSFFDFKEDKEGNPKITELNAGRFGTTIHFYSAAGLNLPHILVQCAFGETPEEVQTFDALPSDLYWLRTIDCGPVLIKGNDIRGRFEMP